MHIERIRFDRIFDAEPRGGDFSFASGGKSTYGVRLPGRAIPREGAVLALAFARPGDWSSVLGWRDLATREVELGHPWWELLWYELDMLWLLVPFVLVGGMVAAGGPGLLAAAALAAAVATLLVVRVARRNRRLRRLLQDIQA